MIKGIKKENKNTLTSFGVSDFADEISMLSEISTLQDVEIFCTRRRLKVRKKLGKFRKEKKN